MATVTRTIHRIDHNSIISRRNFTKHSAFEPHGQSRSARGHHTSDSEHAKCEGVCARSAAGDSAVHYLTGVYSTKKITKFYLTLGKLLKTKMSNFSAVYRPIEKMFAASNSACPPLSFDDVISGIGRQMAPQFEFEK